MASITKDHPGSYSQLASSLKRRLGANRMAFFLFGLATISAVIYGLGFVRIANLFELYQKPILNLYTLPQGGEAGLRQVILAFLALGMLYWSGWRLAGRMQEKAGWIIVIGGTLVFGLILLMMYPFDATDLFENVLRGRILGVYGGNPFIGATARYSSDPFYPYIVWRGWPSAYGPGWELAAGLVARLAGDGIVANILAFKALPGVFMLGCVGVVAIILRQIAPHKALAGVFLLAWNPIVLVETWGHGHNDIAMVFWMLVSLLAIVKRRYTLAILALVVGVLFKFIPALLILPVLALGVQVQSGLRRRAAYLVRSVGLAIALVAIAYAPFWEGFKVFNIQSRENLYTASLPSVALNLLVTQGWNKPAAAALVSHAALAAILLFVVWQTWSVWKNPVFQETVRAFALILLVYLMVSCLWFQNWYSLWPIGLAPFLKSGPIRRMAVLFGFFTLSKPLGIGPVLFWPYPELQQPWLEIWLTLGVMGVPWLYGLFNIWRANHETVQT